jgi:alkylhydroperoxidase family enzyme
MTSFPVHTLETAPEASKPALEALKSAFGFVPNIAGAMATSPVLIGALTDLFGRVHGGSFSEADIQVLLLTNAVANDAKWPIAFHSHLAAAQGISQSDIDAIRKGSLPAGGREAALSRLARILIETRGHAGEKNKEDFLEAGFEESHLLEVVAVIAASTITNYTASITKPPLEEILQLSA